MLNNQMERNERIKKHKKIKYLFSFLFLVGVLILIGINLPVFRISNIVINNNITVKEDYMQSILQEVYGTNLFFVKKKNIVEKITQLSEISQVNVKKIYPDTLVVDTLERNGIFYIKNEANYFLIDEKGFIFDEKDNIYDNELILLEGSYINIPEVNSYLSEDNRHQKIIKELTNLFFSLDSSLDKPDSINIESLMDIKIYYNNMCIVIGDSDNLKDKVNRALNTLNKFGLADKKGYIDASYDGEPVFKIE